MRWNGGGVFRWLVQDCGGFKPVLGIVVSLHVKWFLSLSIFNQDVFGIKVLAKVW